MTSFIKLPSPRVFSFFFFNFKCGPFLKNLLNLLQYYFHFMFWLFGDEAHTGSYSSPIQESQGLNPHCVGRRSLNPRPGEVPTVFS